MKKMLLALPFILLFFSIHVLGLLHIIPLYITAPLLFVAILLTLLFVNNRNRFTGL